MSHNKLQILMAVHHELVAAAGLPKSSRPYSAQSNLSDVQKLIMAELKEDKAVPKVPPADDDIPF